MPQHRLHRNCIVNVLVKSPTGARKHPGPPAQMEGNIRKAVCGCAKPTGRSSQATSYVV